MRLDHLAVSAETLDGGAAHVEAALGVATSPGGTHPHMATHNRLIGMGDLYLEVISADPAAPHPGWPRWFDLDRFGGPPRLTNWIVNCADLEAEIAAAPSGVGVPVALARGDLTWRMAVPASGILPLGDAFPALMRWDGTAHPAPRLTDLGLRLIRLIIATPFAAELRAALHGRLADPRVVIEDSAEKTLRAEIMTPHGMRIL